MPGKPGPPRVCLARHHLLFGFLPGKSGDGVVPIHSQLRFEAQQQASDQRGFEASHLGILSDEAAVEHVIEILEGAAR